MAFTVCIALLAALTYGDDHDPHSKLDVLVIVWGTTIGLALTHWFALELSIRLIDDPTYAYKPLDLLVAHLAMAFLVALVASVTVLALSDDFDRLGARVTAATFLGALVAVESRAGGSTWRRSAVLTVVALGIGVTIATVKWYLDS